MAKTQEKEHYKLGDFEGPLDLLLFLIKKNEVNIYDIPIADITMKYLQILDSNKNFDLENITDFYLMAATLLYIKSRMLLPIDTDFDDELEDPRAELVEKLIEHQKYKKLSEIMAEKEKDSEWAIERKRKQRLLPFEDDNIWEEIDVWDLLNAFTKIVSSLSIDRVIDLYEEVSINEKISLINEFLENKKEFVFTELFVKNTIMEIVCSFLAILECVKMKMISIYQNKLFGDIRVMARPESPKTADSDENIGAEE